LKARENERKTSIKLQTILEEYKEKEILKTLELSNKEVEETLKGGRDVMAYTYSKGWLIKQLKERGIRKHPIEQKKLELYKTFIVRQLYLLAIENEKK